MNIRRIILSLFVLLLIPLCKPNPSYAAGFEDFLTSSDSFLVKIVEGIEYAFTFGAEKRIGVLEKHAERKLELAKQYATEGDEEKVQNMLQRYERIRKRLGKIVQNNLTGDILGEVEERIIIQQETIEEIKGMVGTTVKNEIVTMQENVVNEVAEWVVDVNGTEGQTEFFQKVEVVWAPGTEPEDGLSHEATVVIEGGEMKFATGTENTGPSEPDIQNVVIETDENYVAE